MNSQKFQFRSTVTALGLIGTSVVAGVFSLALFFLIFFILFLTNTAESSYAQWLIIPTVTLFSIFILVYFLNTILTRYTFYETYLEIHSPKFLFLGTDTRKIEYKNINNIKLQGDQNLILEIKKEDKVVTIYSAYVPAIKDELMQIVRSVNKGFSLKEVDLFSFEKSKIESPTDLTEFINSINSKRGKKLSVKFSIKNLSKNQSLILDGEPVAFLDQDIFNTAIKRIKIFNKNKELLFYIEGSGSVNGKREYFTGELRDKNGGIVSLLQAYSFVYKYSPIEGIKVKGSPGLNFEYSFKTKTLTGNCNTELEKSLKEITQVRPNISGDPGVTCSNDVSLGLLLILTALLYV